MGSVGAPCASVELKLVSELDSKYSVNNVIPQGEIWVRGPSITQGYYNQPTVTKETFSDEWLCTGDIGEIRNDGTIAIIDRKKNLIKLSNGEYVALEKLEAIYKSSKLVQNICAYADPHKTFCVAIVVPLEKELIKLGVEKGVLSDGVHDLADLAKNKNLKKLMLSNLTSVGKAAGLKGGEILGAIALANEEWTIENKLLTAAQKLKRRDIIDEYKVEIDIMYS